MGGIRYSLGYQPPVAPVIPGGANRQVQFNNAGAFGGSPELTFFGTNRLSIGYAAPVDAGFRLDVSGQVRIQGVSGYQSSLQINSIDSPAITLNTTNPPPTSRNWAILNNYNQFGDFQIKQSQTNTSDPIVSNLIRFYIAPNGNVSIGIPGSGFPLGKLTVVGGSSLSTASALLVINNTPSNLFEIKNDGFGYFSNNLSIGNTVNSGYRLDVTGNSRFTGNLILGGASGLVALYNNTPIAQPTTLITPSVYLHVPSSAIHTDDTFDGYTLAQVVKALRDLGALT